MKYSHPIKINRVLTIKISCRLFFVLVCNSLIVKISRAHMIRDEGVSEMNILFTSIAEILLAQG